MIMYVDRRYRTSSLPNKKFKMQKNTDLFHWKSTDFPFCSAETASKHGKRTNGKRCSPEVKNFRIKIVKNCITVGNAIQDCLQCNQLKQIKCNQFLNITTSEKVLIGKVIIHSNYPNLMNLTRDILKLHRWRGDQLQHHIYIYICIHIYIYKCTRPWKQA